MSHDLRYHAETDTYYIQIRGEKYSKINNKIRHISSRLKYIQGEKFAEERLMLENKRKRLIREKWQAERYVKIHASDIPQNASARPIHELTGQIITVSAPEYNELICKLTHKVSGDPPEETEGTLDQA